MTTKTFEDFSAAAQTIGYHECLVREWAPSLVIDTHTHPFDVTAFMVRGEFTQAFSLARNIPHAEHYGAEGATVWVARAN